MHAIPFCPLVQRRPKFWQIRYLNRVLKTVIFRFSYMLWWVILQLKPKQAMEHGFFFFFLKMNEYKPK